jgi:hypothetical protein
MKLARSLTLSLAAAIGSALVATLWLVYQASFGEEGLLTGGELEVGPAISAGHRLIHEAHL